MSISRRIQLTYIPNEVIGSQLHQTDRNQTIALLRVPTGRSGDYFTIDSHQQPIVEVVLVLAHFKMSWRLGRGRPGQPGKETPADTRYEDPAFSSVFVDAHGISYSA